jgi:hypothetical protein
MKIIEVRPSRRFEKYWEAFQGKGVQPAFHSKEDAIEYARRRFGGGTGEIHVYDDVGENIIEKIPIDDRINYPNA